MLQGSGENLCTDFLRVCTLKIFCAISDNFRLCSQISQEWIEILKIGKTSDQLQPLPSWVKKWMNFGPPTVV